MRMGDTIIEWITEHTATVILVMVLLSLAVGSGVTGIEQTSSLDQFETDNVEADKLEFIGDHFGTDDNRTSAQIIIRDENVLSRSSLLSTLYLQQTLRANETVNSTLADDNAFSDLSTNVARTAINEERAATFEAERGALEAERDALEREAEELNEATEEFALPEEELEAWAAELEARVGDLENRADTLDAEAQTIFERDPPLEEQIDQLEGMSDSEVETVLQTVFDDERGVFIFLPTDYESGSLRTDARTLFVSQETDDAQTIEGGAPVHIVESQLAMAAMIEERYGDNGFVFGSGIITDEIDRSLDDSFVIVLPLALLFVTIVLTIAYRDLLDILVGLFGILLVLVWTFGFMGWTGIAFNQIMIAVPVLLVGLSIDYAIHVFMRHREQRRELDDNDGFDWPGAGSTKLAMATVIGSLGVAFVWVTTTAIFGFLSNLVSPVQPIQEFGIVSAFGIFSALLIFGVLVPAIKIQIDSILERRGFDRRKSAFGTSGGGIGTLLLFGHRVAQRSPMIVVVIVFLLTVGGVVGAAHLDTTFEQEDFIADEPPTWMASLPEPFAVGTYSAKKNLDFVNERFLRQDTQTQLLIEGAITADDTLQRVNEAEQFAAHQGSTVLLSSDEADITSPLSVMSDVATRNESFNETFVTADRTGDGVPDTDIEGVYDSLFATDEESAKNVIYRSDDGEYLAFRMLISVRGDASTSTVITEARDLAAMFDGGGWEATATGQRIVFGIIEEELFRTVLESLAITLVSVFAFLMIAYRWIHGSAILGAITLAPIVLSVTWILGTMHLLAIPFNVMTGTITSLTVGLGVAYNIHMTERYMLERRRGREIWEGLYRTVTGTGGALLGSAATTVGGFGVLMFAILPPLTQFGLITGLTIAYAFLASVFVLPSLLVLWTRFIDAQGRGIMVRQSRIDSSVGGHDDD